MKKTSPDALTSSRNLPYRRFVVTAAAVAALLVSFSLRAALPTPLVNLRFSEGTGATTINSGSLAGEAVLVQPDGSGLPVLTNFTPSGVFAPAGNTSSLDLGAIAAAEFGRSVDLTTTGGDGTGTLGSLTKFTICGWLNARALTMLPMEAVSTWCNWLTVRYESGLTSGLTEPTAAVLQVPRASSKLIPRLDRTIGFSLR
jgi:hypothetical protein